MALSYIAPGAAVTAAGMNLLFAEYDRKLTRALGGKSHLLVTSIPTVLGEPNGWLNEAMLGKCFFFIGASPSYYTKMLPGYTGDTYDHTVFEDAVAACTPVTWDDERQYVTVTDLTANLQDSLEAHYLLKPGGDGVTRYYLKPDAGVYDMPEKNYRYTVAEIICDGVEEVEIPAWWVKHECFRVHNFSLTQSVTVSGRDDPEAEPTLYFTLPPLGVKSFRRRSKPTGYTYIAGLNYFWKWIAGDPCFFNCEPTSGRASPSFTGLPPYISDYYSSMSANNLANPSLLCRWMAALAHRSLFDYSVPYAPMPEARNYGNPASDETFLQDLVHHKGKIVVASKEGEEGAWTFTEIQHTGRAALAATLGAQGLTVTETDGVITVAEDREGFTTDLICLGTNLFKSGTTQRVAFNVNTPVAIENELWYLPYRPFNRIDGFGTGRKELVEVNETRSYSLWNGAGYTAYDISGKGDAEVREDESIFPKYEVTLSNTIGDLKVASDNADPSSEYGLFVDTACAITPFGFTFKSVETVIPVGVVTQILGGDGWIIDIVNESTYRSIVYLPAYGFSGFASWEGDQSVSSVVGRTTNVTSAGIWNARNNIGNTDFDIIPVAYKQTDIAIQQCLTDRVMAPCDADGMAGGLQWQYYNPDFLHKFEATDEWYQTGRLHLLSGDGVAGGDWTKEVQLVFMRASQFNLWAWLVNCWKSFTPWSITEYIVEYATDTYSALSSETATLPRGGLAGWNSEYYDAINSAWCAAFGITPLDEDDLPASYQSLVKNKTIMHRHLDVVSGAISVRDVDTETPQTLLAAYGPSFKWIRHADVATAAEALGLQFHCARLVRPSIIVEHGARAATSYTMPSYSEPFTFDYDDYDEFDVVANFSPATSDEEWEWSVATEVGGGSISGWGTMTDFDGDDVAYLYGNGSTGIFVYPDSSAAMRNSIHGHKLMLGLEASSNSTGGATVENRLLFSPQNAWVYEQNFLQTTYPGQAYNTGATMDAYRPVEFFSHSSSSPVYAIAVADEEAENPLDNSQLLAMPDGMKRCHVYLQSVFQVDL